MGGKHYYRSCSNLLGRWVTLAIILSMVATLGMLLPAFILGLLLCFLWKLPNKKRHVAVAIIFSLILWGLLFGSPIKKVSSFRGVIFISYEKNIISYLNQLKIAIVKSAKPSKAPKSFYPIKSDVALDSLRIYIWFIPLFAFLRFIFPWKFSSVRMKNSEGYIETEDYQLEHRNIAETILGRKLKPYEIVHHISGIKADNSLGNLCVMSKDKHEHFHAWLQWKKEKTGKYPTISSQKKTLSKHYKGKLLG